MTEQKSEVVDVSPSESGETLDQQVENAQAENIQLKETDEKVTATLAAKIFTEEMIFVPFVTSEQEALKKVTDMRIKLWQRLKDEAGLEFSKPIVDPKSIDELYDQFSKDLFLYFIEREYIVIDGTDKDNGRFNIYQNIYPVEKAEEKRLGDYFEHWKNLFPENNWTDHQANIVYGGEGMGSDFFYEMAEGMLGGMHKHGYALVLSEKKSHRPSTLANEIGHVFFEEAMGFSPEDSQKTFLYDGTEYTIHNLSELVSDISEMRYGNDIDGAIKRISASSRDGYRLSRDIIKKYDQAGSSSDTLTKIEQETFQKIYPLAKKAINTKE